MDVINKLSGYKTYITVGITIMASLIAAIHGGATPAQAGMAALVSLAVAFARAGSKRDAVHSAAIVVANLAPIVGKLAPTDAPLATVVETAATDVAEETAPVAIAAVAIAPAPAAEPAPLEAAPTVSAIADEAPIVPAATLEPVQATAAADIETIVSAVLARIAVAAKATA